MPRTLAALALSLALVACGRVRFQRGDAGMDAGRDAVAFDAVMNDAVMNDAVMNDAVMNDVFIASDVGTDAPRDVGADATRDAGADAPLDGGSDAPRDTGSDASMVDAGSCAAILAAEASFTDDQVRTCASRGGGIGSCAIFDNSGYAVCPGCACEWYQQNTRVTCAACPNRWTPTGCTDFGGPISWAPECGGVPAGRDLAVCLTRALIRAGECDPCVCPP